jgi:hypothetical protein
VPEDIVVADIVREPQDKVPALTFIVQVKPDDGLGIKIFPETLREFVPLIVTDEFEVVIFAKVNELQDAAISTVTLMP